MAVGCKPAADVARILDKAGVPNILWALALVGSNLNFPEIEFVIPDSHMQSAIYALTAEGFSPCDESRDEVCDEWCFDSCDTLTNENDDHPPEKLLAENRFHPVGEAHFHLESKYTFFTVVTLHAKSEILWWLPNPQLGRPAEDHPDLMLSNDPRLPPQDPKPQLFTEAVMYLHCRDWGNRRGLSDIWLNFLQHLSEDEKPGKTVVKKHLKRPIFQDAWAEWHRPHLVENVNSPLRQLAEKLKKNHELPLRHWQ